MISVIWKRQQISVIITQCCLLVYILLYNEPFPFVLHVASTFRVTACCWLFQDQCFSPVCVSMWLFSVDISVNLLPRFLQPLAFVGSHVPAQVSSTPESSPARCAFKRLLARVHYHVLFQCWPVTKALLTRLASVRLLPCMNSDVNFQVAGGVEVFATGLATMRFLSGVAPHVNSEPAAVFEAFPTRTTRVQLLVGVDFKMRFQSRWIIETLPAGSARMSLYARVNPQVSLQCPLRLTVFSTIVTFRNFTLGKITVDLLNVSDAYITFLRGRSLLLYDNLLFLPGAEFLLFLFNLWRLILFHTGALPA